MPNFPQNPALNQIVTWQGYEYQWNGQQWVNLVAPDPTTVPVYISASAPVPPLLQGSFWYNTVNSSLYIWVFELGQDQWIEVSGVSGELPYVYVSISPPADPVNGTLWYQPSTSTLSIWVVVGLTSEWRTIASNSPTPTPPCVVVSSSPPPNPTQGLLWYRTTNHTLYVWVVTLSGSSWEEISGPPPNVGPTVYVSTTAPLNPEQGDLWWQPSLQELRVWNEGVTNQWLLVTDNTPQSQTPPVYISIDEPVNPKTRYLWFNPQTEELKVWTSVAWESVSTSAVPVPPPVAVSVSFPPSPEEGDLWFNPITGILSVWYVDIDGGQWLATVPYALIEAAAEAAASAEEAAASAALAEYYAEIAADYFGEVLIDSSTAPGIIYVGKAPAGSSESAPVWTIRRSTYDNAGNLLTTGVAYNVAWTDRTTVIYT